MAQLFSASIDVSKISKDKLVKGQKGTYANITIAINDEVDQYGNQASIYESQSKEDREAKVPRNYLGNGKNIYDSNSNQSAKKAPQSPQLPEIEEDSKDLPF